MNFLRQGFRKLSYIDKQRDATEIIYYAASRVVDNCTVWIKLVEHQGGHRYTIRGWWLHVGRVQHPLASRVQSIMLIAMHSTKSIDDTQRLKYYHDLTVGGSTSTNRNSWLFRRDSGASVHPYIEPRSLSAARRRHVPGYCVCVHAADGQASLTAKTLCGLPLLHV